MTALWNTNRKRGRRGLVDTGRNVAPIRRRRPGLETLEGRQLMTYDFAAAFGVGGAGITVNRIALDDAGDSFVTGSFTGRVDFDPTPGGTAGANVLDAGSLTSAFVAKYSPSNTLVWVKSFNAATGASVTSSAEGRGIAVDSHTGSIYVAGNFVGTVDFDPDPGSKRTLTSAGPGSTDGFVVKLTPDGALDSTLDKRFGGASEEAVDDLTLSPDGSSLYITGNFSGSANFDPGGSNFTLSAAATSRAYLLKLTSSLGFSFAVDTLLDASEGLGVAVDSSGNTYVTGYTDETGVVNAFVTKFTSAGIKNKTVTFGTGPVASADRTAVGSAVVISSAGNVYVAGRFTGTGNNFEPDPANPPTTLSSAGGVDGFLVKLESTLDLAWARRFGSTDFDYTSDLAIDGSNTLYVTGVDQGPVRYGTTVASPIVLDTGNAASAAKNGFVLVASPDGSLVQALGARGNEFPSSIAINGPGLVAIAGSYDDTSTFKTTTLPVLGTEQAFVATLAPVPPVVIVDPPGRVIVDPPGPPNNGNNNNNSSNSSDSSGGVTPPPAPQPPRFQGEQVKTKRKHGQKVITGFQLFFDAPIDAGRAQVLGNYQLTQPGRKKHSAPKFVVVTSAVVGPINSVTLNVGKADAKKRVSLRASGLAGANGLPIAPFTASL
jgi:hypothetical protein